jgi:hypothetical protein
VTPTSKPVTRVTTGTHRGRRLVCTLGPGDVLYLRPLRRRQGEGIDLASCYDLAIKRRVARERWEKARAKKS